MFAAVWVMYLADDNEREDVLKENPEFSAYLFMSLFMTGGILAGAFLVYLWSHLRTLLSRSVEQSMNTNSTRAICGLYTRVSSRNQADADYSSLETQRERLEAYCRSQDDYTIYRVYEDGGYSADSLDRPALKEMLRDIREGRLNCVLTYKIDRLTRSVKDFHQLMDVFDRYAVKFVSVTQSLDTQNPMGRLLRNILLDFAQFEREMTADRTRDKMYQRAEKGLWNGGNVPYGYRAENKRLMVNAQEAERVRFMFHRFADAPSLARLRDELHRRGWYTRSGKPWSKTALDQILRNPVYCGLVRFNEERFKGEHEALIEESCIQESAIGETGSRPQLDQAESRFSAQGVDPMSGVRLVDDAALHPEET